jgi:hypothetical protein
LAVKPHPTPSNGEGFFKDGAAQVLSFGEDLGEAKVFLRTLNFSPIND